VAHDAVRDLEDARDLVERRGLDVEVQQVVEALGLLVDLEGEAAPAPGVVRHPRPAGLLGQLADARHDLGLALLGQVRVQQQQNFV
jgi:hypothetical protein